MSRKLIIMVAWAAAMAVLLCLANAGTAELSPDFYKESCPRLEEIATHVLTTKQSESPTTAAAALRLFFHDCFVGGCDASVLVTTNPFNRAERDADDNISLPGDGFDAVIRLKTALELQCPGVVSCADILALATRNLVVMVGGPLYTVRFGRKDGLASAAASVTGNLPRPNMTMDELISLFEKKNFSVQELVALSGAHTVGFSHCSKFASRIYGQKDDGYDAGLNPKYARALQKACAGYQKDPSLSTFNDAMTPGKFDNMYYKNLLLGMGLLASDTVLAADDRTKQMVELYASNETAFFDDFSRAMEKLSLLGVKTGEEGEIRRRCDHFNVVPHASSMKSTDEL